MSLSRYNVEYRHDTDNNRDFVVVVDKYVGYNVVGVREVTGAVLQDFLSNRNPDSWPRTRVEGGAVLSNNYGTLLAVNGFPVPLEEERFAHRVEIYKNPARTVIKLDWSRARLYDTGSLELQIEDVANSTEVHLSFATVEEKTQFLDDAGVVGSVS